jgi:DNA-binding response OmpR family regulator
MPTSGPPAASLVFDQPTRILVVDDDPLLTQTARAHLSNEGAEVETAADGHAALDLLRRREFDLAIVDIEMPGLNGFQLVAKMQADAALHHVPVIMLSVRQDNSSIDSGYLAGIASYLTKPVDWQRLRRHVEHVIAVDRLLRSRRR